MLGSKAPNNDANGLFRATHSHNPTRYSHIMVLTPHFYAHIGAGLKVILPPVCKHTWFQTFWPWHLINFSFRCIRNTANRLWFCNAPYILNSCTVPGWSHNIVPAPGMPVGEDYWWYPLSPVHIHPDLKIHRWKNLLFSDNFLSSFPLM